MGECRSPSRPSTVSFLRSSIHLLNWGVPVSDNNKPMCDCLGCAVGGECCAIPVAPQEIFKREPDAYLEARLSLVEEMFAQLLGGVPQNIAVQISAIYNLKRREILKQFYPDLKEPPPAKALPEKGRIIFPH